MKQNRNFYLLIILGLLFPVLSVTPANAGVTTNPTFELDASNPNSFSTSDRTRWYDLTSNRSIFGTNTGDGLTTGVTDTSVAGGALNFSGAGSTGFYFPASAAGTPTNPSGSITVETWIRFSSWNTDWNIFATRWFSSTLGGAAYDFHFAVRGTSTRRLNLYTTNNVYDIWGTAELSLNTWYQLGFTLDNSSNLLRFFINGQQDGSTITGISRSPNTSSLLFVGDARSNCVACSFNGQMARFRIWNTALTSSQILSNFRSEGADFGYLTTTTLSAATSPNSNFRTTNLITATVSKPGKVTFYQQGVVIPGCKNRTATSTATCNWKPSRRGKISVTASLTPTDLGFVPSSGSINFNVLNRSGSRS